MRQDLNDLAVFAAIVEWGSFKAAAEHLAMGKSQVSDRIARLEKRLAMRLLHRTTRQQRVTSFGRRYYRHCRTMLDAAERAQRLADRTTDTPCGSVRAVAPPLFSQMALGPIVVDFMRAYPDVSVVLDQAYGDIDIVADGYDLAFYIHDHIEDSSLVARAMGEDRHLLVASPRLLAGRAPVDPADLAGLPTLSAPFGSVHGRYQWHLERAKATKELFRHEPRLVTDDLLTLRAAAVAGQGVVALPAFLCAPHIADGALTVVLPRWSLPVMNVYAVFPTRQGQPPAVRAFIDVVAPRVRQWLDEVHAAAGRGVQPAQRSVVMPVLQDVATAN